MGDMELQVFSDRIKELRLSLKLTQMQFIDGLGITAAALSAYEKNQKNPSISVAKRIAKKYRVSIDWLCGLSDKKNLDSEMLTYANIMRFIVELGKIKELDMTTCVKNLEGTSFQTDASGILSFKDYAIVDFMKDLEPLKKLYDSNTIDNDLYELWVNKRIDGFDRPVDGLPFG